MVAVTEESNVMDETIKTTKKSKKSKKRTQEEDDVAIPAKKQKVDKGSDSDTSKKSKKNKKEKSLDTSVVDESENKKKKRKSAADTSVVTEEETETPKKEKKKKKQKVEENGTANGTENGNGDASLNEETETPKQGKTKKKKQKAEENGVENGKGDASDNDCGLTPEEREGALSNFNISQPTLEKLQERGVKYLFPIQSKTFNHVYGGHDVIAQARTGTGKTLAFSIPLVERLQEKGGHMQRGRAPRVIVMAPTRELAKQVGDDFSSISSQLSVLCVYGGTPYFPQEKQLNSGVDVLVGTPGRIGDLVEKGVLNLSKLEHVVLDEVDRMLDMGFADKVEEILANAYNKEDSINPQTLLFTATLPAWVYQTAKKYMKENVHRVDLIGQQTTRTATTVQHFAIKCSYFERAATIGQVLSVYSGNHGRAMVFCQTKKDADELAVSDSIKQETHVMHGDIPQDKREMVLKGFREGRYKCLITTDVAARGLDIPEVDLVIQCSIPQDIDSYIHRSGRTGRAGRTGTCVLFYKPREDGDVQWVENKAGIKFKRIGAPTAEDMIKSAAEDAVRSINSVPKATLDQFRESAKSLLEEKDPEEAIAAALACISGNTGEIKARSLLNSSEGYTTYFFRTNIEMRSLSYAWRALENKLGAEYKEKIKGMTFTKDKMGCVFDFPSDLESYMDDHWVDGKFDSLEKATELPELAVSEGFSSPGGRGGFRGRGGGFGGRGGFRGRGGSRGGSGGFRGRGGSRGGFSRGRGSGMTIGGPQQNTKKTFD